MSYTNPIHNSIRCNAYNILNNQVSKIYRTYDYFQFHYRTFIVRIYYDNPYDCHIKVKLDDRSPYFTWITTDFVSLNVTITDLIKKGINPRKKAND